MKTALYVKWCQYKQHMCVIVVRTYSTTMYMYLSKFVGIWVQKIMHIMWHDKTSLIIKHPLIMTEYISN